MSYLVEKYEQLAKAASAERLDGKPGISEREKLAIAYAVEQYELVDFEAIKSTSPDLFKQITADISKFYSLLKGKKPNPQIIYVNFFGFDAFYNQKIKSYTGQDVESFKKDLLREIQQYFTLPNGKKLNIEFVTTQPKKGKSYTEVALTPQSMFDYIYSSDEHKRQFVRALPNDTNDLTRQRIQEITKKVRGKHHIAQDALLVKVAEDPEFIALIKESTTQFQAYTIQPTDLEFGNRTPNEMLYFSAAYLSTMIELAPQDPGRAIYKWFNQDKRNLLLRSACTIAHEIGHALGLKHPRDLLRHWHENHGNPLPYPIAASSNNIMYMPFDLEIAGLFPKSIKFSDFALDYFKFILGVKK